MGLFKYQEVFHSEEEAWKALCRYYSIDPTVEVDEAEHETLMRQCVQASVILQAANEQRLEDKDNLMPQRRLALLQNAAALGILDEAADEWVTYKSSDPHNTQESS